MKITTQKVNLTGEAGNLQALLDLPIEQLNTEYIAVNCHPHSLHGGSMTNKVTHTVSKAIAGLGIPSLRFNFRGVGESEGEYDEGLGEQQDLKIMVEWMKQKYPQAQLILTGFSFGSYVAGLGAEKVSPSLLISVAPPVKRFDFSSFVRPDCEWRVIIGDADELVEYSEVTQWVKSFTKMPELTTMVEASHFFHGRLIELREHIESFVTTHLQAHQPHSDK